MTIINNSIFRTCSRRPAAYEYMTRDYVSVQEGASVREAMRSLVRQAASGGKRLHHLCGGRRRRPHGLHRARAAHPRPRGGTRSPPSRSATSPP